MAKKILVVDDEIQLLDLVAQRLRDSGYEVFVASDALHAVKVAINIKPDLIILDMRMPAGGGLGAYDILKRSIHTSVIPIIFATAYPTDDIRQRVLAKGARDFITKPFKFEELLSKVKKALGEEEPENKDTPPE